jgi:hypothetical protein
MKEEIFAVDTIGDCTVGSIKDGILAVWSEVNILSRVLKMEHLL